MLLYVTHCTGTSSRPQCKTTQAGKHSPRAKHRAKFPQHEFLPKFQGRCRWEGDHEQAIFFSFIAVLCCKLLFLHISLVSKILCLLILCLRKM
ncbi:unnamed protein product [Ixodes pacificus]